MNLKPVLAAVLFAVSTGVHAQSGGMKDAKGTVHKAGGVVTKVAKDKVTIKHGPVPSIGWPSMTMAFTVRDKVLMDKFVLDRKVDFEFVQEGRDYVVTAVK